MSKTKTCPHCNTKVPIEAEHCPNCPASFPVADASVVRHARRGPPSPYLPFLGVAVLAVVAWRALNFVTNYFAKEAAEPPTRAEAPETPENLNSSAPVKFSAEPPEETPQVVVVSQPKKKKGGKKAESPAPKTPLEDAAAADEWKLRGSVYDLVTLRPLAGVALEFKDVRTARSIETVADREGRYRLTVPTLPGRGYNVVIRAKGYASSYLNPDMEKVQEKAVEDRKSLASELNRSLNGTYTVQGHDNDPWVTDFYLAPKEF